MLPFDYFKGDESSSIDLLASPQVKNETLDFQIIICEHYGNSDFSGIGRRKGTMFHNGSTELSESYDSRPGFFARALNIHLRPSSRAVPQYCSLITGTKKSAFLPSDSIKRVRNHAPKNWAPLPPPSHLVS